VAPTAEWVAKQLRGRGKCVAMKKELTAGQQVVETALGIRSFVQRFTHPLNGVQVNRVQSWCEPSARLLHDDHVHAPGSESQGQRQGLRAPAGGNWRGPGARP
jgi:hypothetical protein